MVFPVLEGRVIPGTVDPRTGAITGKQITDALCTRLALPPEL